MVDALKQGGAFMGNRIKALFAPDNTLTMVHGNQKAVVRKDSIEVWDLDAGTITRADVEKKTYYVTTFADMRKGFTEGQKKLAELQAKNADEAKAGAGMRRRLRTPPMTFDVKVNNTGVSKMVNGLMAQEQIITMSARMVMPPDAANGGGCHASSDAGAPERRSPQSPIR